MTMIRRPFRLYSIILILLSFWLSACVPNTAVTPMNPGFDSDLTAAEQEQGRYGTLLRLAASTRSAGDSAAAVNMYQQAISLDRSRPEAYTLLGDTLIELDAHDQAAEVFAQSLKIKRDSVAAQLGYGRSLLALQRPESAIPHYESALKQVPGDLQVLNGLGVAYDLAGEHRAAQKVYRDGLAVAPDSMLLRNNLGLSLALAGDHEDAVSLLTVVADEPSASSRNRQNLALAHGLAGDLAAAERISRLDLDEEGVRGNVAYFAALAAMDDERKRAAALGMQSAADGKAGGEAHSEHRLRALTLGGSGIELALMPTGRWFLNLGSYASPRQVASAWRTMRASYGDLIGDLDRLAGREEGRQPLLVGPLASATDAEEICKGLEGRGQTCKALAL